MKATTVKDIIVGEFGLNALEGVVALRDRLSYPAV